MHTPRSGAGLLRALLQGVDDVAVAPDASDLLQLARRGEADPEAQLLEWTGKSSTLIVPLVRFGAWAAAGQQWQEAVDAMSWLREKWPDARLLILTRGVKDCSSSMEFSWPLWVESYGKGLRSCIRQMQAHREYLLDFCEMNPVTTRAITFEDLSKPNVARPLLESLGITTSEEVWDAVRQAGKPVEDFPPPPVTLREIRQEEAIDEAIIRMRRFESARLGVAPEDVVLQRPVIVTAAAAVKETPLDKHMPQLPRPFTEFFPEPEEDLPTMGISIMAHPSRAQRVEELQLALGGDIPVSYDEGGGLIANCAAAWRMHDPDTDYHLVLQDDTILCDDFVAEARRILKALPSPRVVSFFHGNRRPYVEKAREAIAAGLDFTENHAVPGPAICLPTSWIAGMLDSFELQKHRKDDVRISNWLEKTGRLALFPLPCLVEHAEGPSLAGNPGRRPAVSFVKNRRQPPEGLIDGPRAIFYQWLSTAANWDELKYSLRALLAHFADKDCPIYVVCDRAPEWYLPGHRLKVITVDSYRRNAVEGLWDARKIGLQCAEKILQIDDDIYLLKDLGWEDFEVAFTTGQISGREAALRRTKRAWTMAMAEASFDMQKAGVELPYLNFSAHTPFLWERRKMMEILRRFHIHHRGSLENYYFNVFKPATRSKGDLVVETLPAGPDAILLNHAAGGPSDETRAALQARFPEMAPWEARVPKIIHQTWKDNAIPRDIYPEKWTASWKSMHPEWDYRFWTDDDLKVFAATHYPDFHFLIREARGVIKADVGRLLLLHHFGGLYADMDYLCLKPMDNLVTGNSAFVSTLGRNYTHNALMACAPGYPLMMEAALEALKRWNRNRDATPEFISGPELITSLVRKYRPTHWAQELVCPIDWRIRRPAVLGEADVVAEYPDAHAVTFWRHNW